MAHAYFVIGAAEEGIEKAIEFAERALDISGRNNPDLIVLRYGLFSVDEARQLMDIAIASPIASHKVVIVSATRFFHEAQNALLKLFEEPPENVTLILILPSLGVLLPTLRSRLAPLQSNAHDGASVGIPDNARAFLKASAAERERIVVKLIDKSKAGSDDERQQARNDAVQLMEGLLKTADLAKESGATLGEREETQLLIGDLLRFMPLLHTRSAPLKLIFEHLLIVIPKGLSKAVV